MDGWMDGWMDGGYEDESKEEMLYVVRSKWRRRAQREERMDERDVVRWMCVRTKQKEPNAMNNEKDKEREREREEEEEEERSHFKHIIMKPKNATTTK